MTDPDLRRLLLESRRIAVVGLSPRPSRPSHSVAAYLKRAGYTVIPVRPAFSGTILGETVYPDLPAAAAAAGPIDIVNVFRRSAAIPDLLGDIIAVRPRLVWLQVGVIHDPSARKLETEGIPVVQDRCLAVDHHALVAA